MLNCFGKKISILKELEDKYDLTISFIPGEEKKLLHKIKELLRKKRLNIIWNNKKTNMLKEKIDFNQWMIEFFNKESKNINL